MCLSIREPEPGAYDTRTKGINILESHNLSDERASSSDSEALPCPPDYTNQQQDEFVSEQRRERDDDEHSYGDEPTELETVDEQVGLDIGRAV